MERSKVLVLLVLSFFATVVQSQEKNHYYYFVEFIEKENTELLSNPVEFLTQKAIDRRTKSNIPITKEDLPISKKRIQKINTAVNITVHYALKWDNGVLVSTPEIKYVEQLLQLEFVRSIKQVKRPERFYKSSNSSRSSISENIYSYGLASDQINLINIPFLHQREFTGEGVTIALFDNGFKSLDTFPLFDHLWKNNQILGQYDIVQGDNDAIPHGGHGTGVLSTIGAKSISDTMTGSAPSAAFYLFRTEDNASETMVEEYNWARGAEIADSLGVDIINSSLGYSWFEDTTTSYTYADMDGNSTVVTRAANVAFRKGILVVNSAGNSGSRDWRYIIAPADGFFVLAVGATDSVGQIADFSSRGPNASGWLKPNVSAVGAGVVIANGIGSADKSNGTSFSAPTIAGAAACLFQAFPKASNKEVFEAIEASSDRFENPDFDYGNGIPDFKKAFEILDVKYDAPVLSPELIRDFLLYPNPVSNVLNIDFFEFETMAIEISIFNYTGKQIFNKHFGEITGKQTLPIKCMDLGAGLYVIELKRGLYSQRKTFVKY